MMLKARALLWLLVAHAVAALQAPSWSALSKTLPSAAAEAPRVVDAVQHQQKRPPPLSDDTVVLYRERHGWCPYSDRVWRGLGTKSVAYETVRLDNTGGARPVFVLTVAKPWFRDLVNFPKRALFAEEAPPDAPPSR